MQCAHEFGLSSMRALDSLIVPSDPQRRLASLRKLLSLPEEISVFYAFGSPLEVGRNNDGPRSDLLLFDSRVENWWKEYRQDQNRYRDDPVRRTLRRTTAPVVWNKLVRGGQIERSDDDLWETVRRHEIRAGLSIPLRDPLRQQHGSLAFVGFCHSALFDEWWRDMSLEIVGTVHLFHQGLLETKDQNRGTQLSPREKQCLAHVARGMSSKEIARSLGLSPRTVDLHIARATKRLGAANRIEATITALRDGYF